MNISTTNKRNGYKWSVPELLKLEREYELLEWTVQKIAVRHNRTVEAILIRLVDEGIITSWDDARGFDAEEYKNSIDNDNNEEKYTDYLSMQENNTTELDNILNRIWSLETNVTAIGRMVNQMFDKLLVVKKKSKREPLRKTINTGL